MNDPKGLPLQQKIAAFGDSIRLISSRLGLDTAETHYAMAFALAFGIGFESQPKHFHELRGIIHKMIDDVSQSAHEFAKNPAKAHDLFDRGLAEKIKEALKREPGNA